MRYETPHTMRPLPQKYAKVYKRRGMTIPTLHSGHDEVALLPYRYRRTHEVHARVTGHFWLPCPLCTEPFGGHEITDSIPDPINGEGCYVGICPKCTAERNGGRV